ncbi:YihY family inner membrane protein [Pedobacter westerhofensis]|uniref:YihY family inner membrane protein n=1 Tax=Pedobacter westerhofensis TaxID=425512 RepID=A0A521FVM6_9SPHI|nr:YihY/virulence factor BrkB family protein [Pedobacter westerhofensis]SMO99620.1 YihY family inner membrane protein [Pedobacter westerhofensis]
METKVPKDFTGLWANIQTYFRIQMKMRKLAAIEKGSKLAANLVTNTIVVLCLLMAFTAALVTLTFYLSHLLKSYTVGFGCATVLFTLLSLLICWKNAAVEQFITGVAIRGFFATHHEPKLEEAQGHGLNTFNGETGQRTKLLVQDQNEPGHSKKFNMKNKNVTLRGIWAVLKNSFTGFSDHKVTKLSGSLAYYTVFSMAPLLVVIISLCGIFLGQEAAQGQIYGQLAGFMGKETALQLQEIVQKASIGKKGTIAFIIGAVTLLVGATTVFADIQDSINIIWGLKPKPKRGWLKMLQNRFLSFSVIISLGFLLLVSLGVTAVLDGFSARLQVRFSDVSVVLFYILNQVVTLAVVSLIFSVIFKLLPDAIIKWRDVISGSVITALLFMLGKFGISIYIGQSDVGSTYGAAGSLVILLLWTYYSSIILYFGAEFTKAFALSYGSEIHPSHYAVTTKEVELESGGQSVQENEETARSKS